jgi:hypothetical protein
MDIKMRGNLEVWVICFVGNMIEDITAMRKVSWKCGS